jgi:hypothetical protein
MFPPTLLCGKERLLIASVRENNILLQIVGDTK